MIDEGIGTDGAEYVQMSRSVGVARPASIFNWPLEVVPRIALDLSHAAAEGELPKNFRIISHICAHYHPSFWGEFSNGLNQYLKENHLPSVGRIASWNAWDLFLNMQSKLTSCLVSPLLFKMHNVVPVPLWEKYIDNFEAREGLVELVKVLTKHRIPACDLQELKPRTEAVYSRLSRFYSSVPDCITINSHYMMHCPSFIQENGVPREYWVFGQEKEIGGMKQASRHTNSTTQRQRHQSTI